MRNLLLILTISVNFSALLMAEPGRLPSAPTKSSAQPFDAGYLSILGFTFETSLSDIKKKLGPAPIEALGNRNIDDGIMLCYASAQPNDRTTVIFEGSGEMGLSDFKVFSHDRSPSPASKKCSLSQAVSRAIETPSGLKLGMKAAELIAKLGPPAVQDERWMKWSRTGEGCQELSEETKRWWKANDKPIPPAGCEKYSFDSVIEVNVDNGVIVSFSVHSVETT